MWDGNSASWSHRASEDFFSKCILLLDVFWAPVAGKQEDASHTHATKTGDTCFYRRVYFSMMQSCIKLEVGRKDADTSLPLSHPSHSMSLVHNNGISQGGETKHNHCRLPKGTRTVAAETGLSRWLSALGLQALGLPQHMEDTNTGDMCHGFKWLKQTSIELMWRLIFCCCSLALQLMVLTTLHQWTSGKLKFVQIFQWAENFLLSFGLSLAECFGKKYSWLYI